MKINEIFYSLQGEGHFTGTPAIFIRLSGCNLKCDFCDTQHQSYTEISEEEIIMRIAEYNTAHIVITGGEPTLQLTASLVEKLHLAGKFVQIETNGAIPLSHELLRSIDWITCSPKYGKLPALQRIDELKVVFDYRNAGELSIFDNIAASQCYLQPCDRNDTIYNQTNVASCVKYILEHPKWKLSLQTHKILSIR